MAINLNDLGIFVQAVEHGSFAAAGRRLGLPKSTISKRVGELEATLGARLIHRTSRSFALTDLGRDMMARMLPLMDWIGVNAPAMLSRN